jgi:hypothetical protein
VSGPHQWHWTRINVPHAEHPDRGPAEVCNPCGTWRKQQPDGSYLYAVVHPGDPASWFAETPERPCWAAPDPSGPSAPSSR